VIPGTKYSPEQLVATVLRHRSVIVGGLVLGAAAAIGAATALPKSYRSEAVILVVPQRVPETYVRSTVTTHIEDRLQSISPEILSGTRLEKIIHDVDLYAQERQNMTMEEILELMRRNIKVETIKGDAFRVSYISGDPVQAMEVTKRLASMFIDENLRDRESLAEGTNQFLESQLNDARARLMYQEKALEDFRKSHAGELPSQVEANLQSIQNTQMQLQAVAESISRNRDRVTLLDGLVSDVLAVDTVHLPVPPPSGSVDATLPAGATPADRLESARRSYASLRARVTDRHPEIRRLERVIRDLEQGIDVAAQPEQPADVEIEPQRPLTTAEAARRDRVREMQAEIKTLRQRIDQEEAERQRLVAAMAQYERRIEAAPTRESQLAELTRDYETLQNVYESLLTRREDSKIAADLERRQIGEQFRILDPPRLPEKPFSPNRLALDGFGALLGLGLGIGLAAVREYRDTSLHTAADVVATLAIPVLALIPMMVNDAERRGRRRRRLLYGSAATAALLLAVAATLAWRSRILL
jgi:polysaccharide chain length determinant protein (PEP-CTERM system associated)